MFRGTFQLFSTVTIINVVKFKMEKDKNDSMICTWRVKTVKFCSCKWIKMQSVHWDEECTFKTWILYANWNCCCCRRPSVGILEFDLTLSPSWLLSIQIFLFFLSRQRRRVEQVKFKASRVSKTQMNFIGDSSHRMHFSKLNKWVSFPIFPLRIRIGRWLYGFKCECRWKDWHWVT